ncbi:MAG TPA: LytR C-terminal domain-containing protein [Actinomycetota bacterium]|nr:LytR C-terminal domain-containing protein [Actinomycetota bacterium]
MNLGTGRILILVSLVVIGVVVLANGFPEGGGAVAAPSASPSSPGASTSPTGGGSTSPQPTATPTPQVQGVTVMALNGTNVTGAAAAAQAMLVQKGYSAPVAAADAPNAGVTTTTVYYRTGADAAQNKSNATQMAKKYFNGAPVKKLDQTFVDVVPATVSIAVVVGSDYASTLTP